MTIYEATYESRSKTPQNTITTLRIFKLTFTNVCITSMSELQALENITFCTC